MMNLILHSLQPSRGAVNFILAQLYIGVNIVDDYQQDFDTLRRQRRWVLWEQAAAQSGVPQYLGSPDDLKLLLMKAVNRKTPHHGYRVSGGNRLSFQGRWYVCPGLLSRLRGREF